MNNSTVLILLTTLSILLTFSFNLLMQFHKHSGVTLHHVVGSIMPNMCGQNGYYRSTLCSLHMWLQVHFVSFCIQISECIVVCSCNDSTKMRLRHTTPLIRSLTNYKTPNNESPHFPNIRYLNLHTPRQPITSHPRTTINYSSSSSSMCFYLICIAPVPSQNVRILLCENSRKRQSQLSCVPQTIRSLCDCRASQVGYESPHFSIA